MKRRLIVAGEWALIALGVLMVIGGLWWALLPGL